MPDLKPCPLYSIDDRNPKGTKVTDDVIAVHNALAKAPTIEAEPVKHGRWEGTADGYWDGELVYDTWNCSECGFDADGADEKPEWNYCPNCGAKMDGGEADAN